MQRCCVLKEKRVFCEDNITKHTCYNTMGHSFRLYTLTPLLFQFNNVHRGGAFGGGSQAAGGTPSFGG